MKTYSTTGTCSRAINYEVQDGVLTKCEFVGGCPGNTQGVAKLVVGRKVEEVVALLKGIQCRNGTSCPDQLARALEAEPGVFDVAPGAVLDQLARALEAERSIPQDEVMQAT